MTTSATKKGDPRSASAGWLGSLAHTPLASVLRRIALEERSGDLQVTSPAGIKTVYFDRGFVVFASSNLKKDRLGESLIEVGRISRHEFALASMLMKSRKEKFGKVLVSAGILSEEELGRYVAAQVNQIVLSLFSVKKGMYSFDERPCAIPVDLMVSLSVYRISIDGVRRMTSKKLVLAGLPPLESRVRVAELPPFTLDVDKLRPVEKQVLRAAGPGAGASIREILGGVEEKDGVVLRACYGLLSGGVLEVVVPDERKTRLRVQEETGTFVLSDIRRMAGVPEAEGTDLPESAAASTAETAPPVEPAATKIAPAATPGSASSAPAPRAPSTSSTAIAEPEASADTSPPGAWSRALRWIAKMPSALVSGWRERFSQAPDSVALRPRPAEPAASPPPEPPARPSPAPAAQAPVEPTPPPAPLPQPDAVVEAPPPEPPVVESLGVPSWSMADAPASAGVEARFDSGLDAGVAESAVSRPRPSVPQEPVVETLGVPSWSMADDPNEGSPEDDPQTLIDSLGVPSWSMKDDPRDAVPVEARMDAREDRDDGHDDAANDSRAFVPSWSLMDPPGEPAKPDRADAAPPVEEVARAESQSVLERETDIETEPDVDAGSEPLGALDNELFMEPESAASIMDSIPVEAASDEVPVEADHARLEAQGVVESEVEVAVDEEEAEIEVDVEVEDETPEVEEETVEVEDEHEIEDEQEVEVEVPVEVDETPEPVPEPAVASSDSQPVFATDPLEIPAASEADAEPTGATDARKPEPQRETPPPLAASSPTPRPAVPASMPVPPPVQPPHAASASVEHDSQPSDRETRAQAMRRMRQSGGEARLFRDVKLHFKMRDWGGAVTLLEQLVEISPGSALYRGLMARAMSRHPRLRKDAEGEFVEALRLAPQDPQLHYWLGQYYDSFGLKSRAITEFRTTLRIDPRHEGARKQLGTGAVKKDGVMKKLFG